MTDEDSREIRDRVRRVETRLTKLCEAMGVDAGGSKPVWEDGRIELPNVSCSFRDVINSIPNDWPAEQAVPVVYRGVRIAVLRKA